MPIFQTNDKVKKLELEDFKDEKDLQTFFEENLETLLKVHFVATELWTGGSEEGGYIDTAGLDQNNSPVVIEYKWKQNENVVNQGLYYIDRILEHKGDFELKVQEALKKNIKVDWKQPRLIIIAPAFNKYDQYAVKRMGGNIELVRYIRYKESILHLETVFEGSKIATKPGSSLNKSAALENPFQQRLDWVEKKSKKTLDLYNTLREQILNLDEKITEKYFKNGLSFRIGVSSFVTISPWTDYIRAYILHRGDKLNDPKKITRNIAKIGKLFAASHDFVINNENEIPYAMELIKQAYQAAL